MTEDDRPATVSDVHEIAGGMPYVKVEKAGTNPVYQVGGKSFVFFRNPRPDAFDPDTGERYDDVIVVWVASESEKKSLIQDRQRPYFTTAHFDGHLSVLVRASKLHEIPYGELVELIQDAWLCRASRRRSSEWLAEHGLA
ncbi:MmcQ/YjbR family DNA-binding protein [Hoyosella altamirensis]|uniref:MmcQ/YjbR family DNA-binding protein n=1 Tax=Hoyosella altamirensis TaxID=616997 RepID=A0A839RKT0_9ACTN|nr:MmcQ/YjbR family DNA-binding protein [Hoyosella altamirensis]MBB3036909.1 hypothetical protein [Hoyosella altamirensis]